MAVIKLLNVYVSEHDKGGRKFRGASINVAPVGVDPIFYNVKVVQGFGELPDTSGYHVAFVHDTDVWEDTQDADKKIIRLRNPLFTKQDQVYETDYNQLDLLTKTELKKVKVSIDGAKLDKMPTIDKEDTPF